MAREAQSIPDRWRELGVLYVVDIDDNQDIWREYRELKDKSERSSEEDARLLELEPQIDDLFVVRIGPYSNEEYRKIERSVATKTFTVSIGKKGQTEVNGDAQDAGENIVAEVCAQRIYEVFSYVVTEPTLDAAGEPTHDDEGKLIGTRTFIKKGDELVNFIRTKAWGSEKAALYDIFRAIRERSHLEKGQKKSWPKRLDS